jgi:hypothetical protein
MGLRERCRMRRKSQCDEDRGRDGGCDGEHGAETVRSRDPQHLAGKVVGVGVGTR